jgi:uncharacterized protein YcbX
MFDTKPQSGGMYIAEIWRYPVKSLAGEQLMSAEVREDGIAGDRRVLVFDIQTQHLITSRTHPKLLGLKGTLDTNGEALINGIPWVHPDAEHAITSAAGPYARLIDWDGPERFDVLPLLVATDGAIAAFGHDRRRLRPNIVIGGVDGLAERGFPGQRVRIGEVVLEFAQLRQRCVMTTYDPDTQVQDHKVLRQIVKQFGGALALDTVVINGGYIAIGDPVEFVDDSEDVSIENPEQIVDMNH